MQIVKELNEAEGKWIFTPVGDIDIYTSNVFKNEVISSFEEDKRDILIDGERLNYVDSTGLGALIFLLKELKDENYKIYLRNIKPNILKLLKITELDKMFVIRGEDND